MKVSSNLSDSAVLLISSALCVAVSQKRGMAAGAAGGTHSLNCPGAGFSGELGRPRPVPGFCRVPFHLRRVREAGGAGSGRAVPPVPGRGQGGSSVPVPGPAPVRSTDALAQLRAGQRGPGAARGRARFRSFSLRACGSV